LRSRLLSSSSLSTPNFIKNNKNQNQLPSSTRSLIQSLYKELYRELRQTSTAATSATFLRVAHRQPHLHSPRQPTRCKASKSHLTSTSNNTTPNHFINPKTSANMSGTKLDQSLDEILKTGRSGARVVRGARRGRRAPAAGRTAPPVGGVKKTSKGPKTAIVPTGPAISGESRIQVSNLVSTSPLPTIETTILILVSPRMCRRPRSRYVIIDKVYAFGHIFELPSPPNPSSTESQSFLCNIYCQFSWGASSRPSPLFTSATSHSQSISG